MKCLVCHEEFDEKLCSKCPYCFTSISEENDTVMSEESEEDIHSLNKLNEEHIEDDKQEVVLGNPDFISFKDDSAYNTDGKYILISYRKYIDKIESITGLNEISINFLKNMGFHSVGDVIVDLFSAKFAHQNWSIAPNIKNNIIVSFENYLKCAFPNRNCIMDCEENTIENRMEEELRNDNEERLNCKIELIKGFNNRSRNVLLRNGILTIKDLVNYVNEHDIQQDLRGVGDGTKENILKTLEEFINADNIAEKMNVSNDFYDLQNSDVPSCTGIVDVNNISEYKLKMKLDAMTGLDTRAKKALFENKLYTVKDLIEYMTEHKTIRELNKIGSGTAKIIEDSLSKILDNDREKSKKRLEEFLDSSTGKKEYDVFLRRSNGETLQGIADSPNANRTVVTRERVRQLQNKFLKQLKPYIISYINENYPNDDYIDLDKMSDLYNVNAYNKIIINACTMLNDEYDYIEFARTCIKKNRYGKWEERFKGIVDKFVGEYINLSENVDEIDEALRENDLEFITIDGIKNYMSENGYNVCGDIIYKKSGYGRICATIIRDYFKEGIWIPSRGVDDVTNDDMNRLRHLLLKHYGMRLESDDGTIGVQLRSYLVMCGKSRYIAPENIHCDVSVLYEIKRYMDDSSDKRFHDRYLFNKYEGILLQNTNINNPYFLHGVLSYWFSDEYHGTNFYINKRDKNVEEITISDMREDQLYNDIMEQGRPISKDEIKKRHNQWSDIMIVSALQKSDKVIQWAYNEYFVMDLLDIDDDDVEKLKEIITESMTPYDGYTNSYLVFDRIKSNYPTFLHKNPVIKNEKNIFYILARLFNNVCEFRIPHIGLKMRYNNLDSNSLVDKLLNYPSEISFDIFLQESSKFGWPESQRRAVFKQYRLLFIQVSVDRYVRKDNFCLNTEILNLFKDVLVSKMELDVYFLGYDHDYKDFPDISYEWNPFLVRSIVENYFSEVFRVIDPISTHMRYQRGVVVMEDSSYESTDHIVAFMMKKSGRTSMSAKSFLSFLSMNGLTESVVPQQYRNSEYIDYFAREETYSVKKSFL